MYKTDRSVWNHSFLAAGVLKRAQISLKRAYLWIFTNVLTKGMIFVIQEYFSFFKCQLNLKCVQNRQICMKSFIFGSWSVETVKTCIQALICWIWVLLCQFSMKRQIFSFKGSNFAQKSLFVDFYLDSDRCQFFLLCYHIYLFSNAS